MRKYCIAFAAIVSILALNRGVSAYNNYDLHVAFLQQLTKDAVKLMPRAMAYYIYQNDYDFFRGITFMIRGIEDGPRKLKDIEIIYRHPLLHLSI